MTATLVAQHTPYSCPLACIESILSSNGIDYPQAKMLQQLESEFPEWEKHPGKAGPDDFPRFFESAGLRVEMLIPDTVGESRELLRDSVGAIMSRAKCWRNGGSGRELVDNWHAVRVLAIGPTDIVVMNPSYPPIKESIIEAWPISELAALEARIYIFKLTKDR